QDRQHDVENDEIRALVPGVVDADHSVLRGDDIEVLREHHLEKAPGVLIVLDDQDSMLFHKSSSTPMSVQYLTAAALRASAWVFPSATRRGLPDSRSSP